MECFISEAIHQIPVGIVYGFTCQYAQDKEENNLNNSSFLKTNLCKLSCLQERCKNSQRTVAMSPLALSWNISTMGELFSTAARYSLGGGLGTRLGKFISVYTVGWR